jgi:hypothetical protein
VKKLLLLLGMTALTVPAAAHANPSVTTRESASTSFAIVDGTSSLFGTINVEATTVPSSNVDPNDLFPIIVDPNDPPSAGTETEYRLYSYLSGCAVFPSPSGPTFRCFGGSHVGLISSDAVTFENLPLPGNRVTLDLDVVIPGPFADLLNVDMQIELAEPTHTQQNACPMCPSVNPWTNGTRVHLDVRDDQGVLYRSGYSGEAHVTLPEVFGPETQTAGVGGSYSLSRAWSADVEV